MSTPWILYMMLQLASGNNLIVPIRDYEDNQRACAEAVVQLTQLNTNDSVRFLCIQAGKET